MSKCCCCCSVTTGATILGLIGLLFSAFELVPLVPFLIESDTFNPIEENIERFYFIVQKILEENLVAKDEIEEIVANARTYVWPCVLGEAISAGIFVLCSFLLIIGVQCRKRTLMLPYMIIQMAAIVIFMLVGIAITVGFFFINIIMGVVCGVVVLVISFLLIYFWMVVQRAFVDVGTYGNYSPAPTVKPMYANSSSLYPSMPHHFQMDESVNGR